MLTGKTQFQNDDKTFSPFGDIVRYILDLGSVINPQVRQSVLIGEAEVDNHDGY